MLATYGMALLVTVLYEWRVVRFAPDSWVRGSGAVVLVANMGVIMFCFTFTPFLTAIGMQYWFLAGALYGVVDGYRDRDP